MIISTPALTNASTLSKVSAPIPTAAPTLRVPCASLQAFGYSTKLSISFIVIRPFKYPASSVIGSFSILLERRTSWLVLK